MSHSNKQICNVITILLNYERGEINLKEAVFALNSSSGLSTEVCKSFIDSLKRNNVVSLPQASVKRL